MRLSLLLSSVLFLSACYGGPMAPTATKPTSLENTIVVVPYSAVPKRAPEDNVIWGYQNGTPWLPAVEDNVIWGY